VESFRSWPDSIYFHGEGGLYVNRSSSRAGLDGARPSNCGRRRRSPRRAKRGCGFQAAKPVQLALRIREPYWTEARWPITSTANRRRARFAMPVIGRSDRAWKNGDEVRRQPAHDLRIQADAGRRYASAIMYGPLVLAGELGARPDRGDDAAEARIRGAVQSRAGAGIQGRLARPATMDRGRSRDSRWLFRDEGQSRDLRMVPFNQWFDQRYGCTGA